MRWGRPLIWALVGVLAVALAAVGTVALRGGRGHSRRAPAGGPAGASGGERDRREHEGRGGGSEISGLFKGPRGGEEPCDRPGHPESFEDLAKANSSRMTRQVAPGTQLKPGAQRAAIRTARELPTIGAQWAPLGNAPLIANRKEYDTTNGSTLEGFVGLSGRVTSFARNPNNGA